MADYGSEKTSSKENPYEFEYKKDYQDDWDVHRYYIQTFDAYEAMLLSQVYDSVSRSIDGAKITDSYNTTLAKERADRVIAKLPDGQTTPAGKADVGKASFMDILRQKWVYPNANAQHPFLEKLNMWQLYSSVYGYMPMFYDWNVSETGYVGPDCWLWNPRHLVPQQGRVSLADMEYVTALTWVSKKFLQDKLDNESDADGWDRDALRLLIEKADQETSSDSDQDTQTEKTRIARPTKRGVCLATRYESGEDGKWCTFAPDHSHIEVRRIKNPHKNGKIPFIIKYSQPLFDSFYGLGDFQRAQSLQFARDALDNFYFKGIKINLIPPIVANANGVVKHTLDYREGQVMLETIPNSIRRLESSPAGLNTYQAAKQALTGSLLALYGSQNASIPGADALNPSQGRTPAAISLYADKEATRDGAERRHLEAALEQLTDAFFSLIANIGTEKIPITLFAEDIKAIIESGQEDLMELFIPNAEANAGTLQIDPAKLKDIEYRFSITTDSMAKINKDAQRQALENYIGLLGKYQNVLKDDPTIKVEWGLIMQAYENVSDISGASKFITITPDAKPQPPPQTPPRPPSETITFKDAVQAGALKAAAGMLNQAGLPADDLQPPQEPEQSPTVAETGHSFMDPHIAEIASSISKMGVNSPPAIEPMISKGGISFNDPHIAKVATAVEGMHRMPDGSMMKNSDMKGKNAVPKSRAR